MEWVPLRNLKQDSTKARVLVVVGQPFTPGDQALLSRMMQAIQLREYTVSHEFCDGPGVALILDSEVAAIKGLKTLGDVLEIGGRRVIFSHSLLDLREGPPLEVQQRKKTAWGHLQLMQTWLGECT